MSQKLHELAEKKSKLLSEIREATFKIEEIDGQIGKIVTSLLSESKSSPPPIKRTPSDEKKCDEISKTYIHVLAVYSGSDLMEKENEHISSFIIDQTRSKLEKVLTFVSDKIHSHKSLSYLGTSGETVLPDTKLVYFYKSVTAMSILGEEVAYLFKIPQFSSIPDKNRILVVVYDKQKYESDKRIDNPEKIPVSKIIHAHVLDYGIVSVPNIEDLISFLNN